MLDQKMRSYETIARTILWLSVAMFLITLSVGMWRNELCLPIKDNTLRLIR